MRPHPAFKGRAIPTSHGLGAVTLKALSVSDLDRDFSAVIDSAAEIKAANPGSNWPDALTREKNLIDLAWHQREFEARRSFAWVIENAAGDYLGCFYIYPSITGDPTAEVTWWWRKGAQVSRQDFRANVIEWLASDDWPRLTYKVQES